MKDIFLVEYVFYGRHILVRSGAGEANPTYMISI